MNKEKRALLPGLSLFVCLGLLTGAERLIAYYSLPPYLMALLELACVGLPLAMALPGMDRQVLKYRLAFKNLPKGGWRLTVFLGAACAFLALGVNLPVYRLTGQAGLNRTIALLHMPVDSMGFGWRLLIGAVLAAVLEELYLRGALQSCHESGAGTSMCLLFSGILFALLHGNPMDLAGPFCIGIALAYLTYVLDSVWAAMLAHAVCGLCMVGVQWAADTYAPFGVWNILPELIVLLLLLFAFLTLHTLEKMLVRGSILHFEVSAGWYDLWLLIRDPGFIVLVLAFAGKQVMDCYL